ncbi:putative DNA-binding domain-containing protein [Janthinobacterium sp. GW460P]|uniref:HvfC/BufC N-terminal domain-containing protein n=1 Tax=unclassified Janthinobacterium TaxID=2610881 RepID=UPI000A3251BD|nr:MULTISPECIES: DNA-binding domain-containing protein [unclassified Janthinobacterium]MCC7702939.1 putative DNA-binding domain-containing protein [Janthinobacterium sp. GW460P]MCC7708447.1 putative DNA-binding domain-containing protein [Janthinobacterium sp. GW460W]
MPRSADGGERVDAPLAQLQAWFLTAMTAPGGAARGAQLASERHGLTQEQVLKRARGGPAPLHIHADGYVQRLLECLQADYPVLRKVMGDELFAFFARAYVWHHPSASPTLYDLGGGFADFLAASQGAAGAQEDVLRFPVELAQLERARSEAGRAPGLEKRAPPLLPSGLDLLLGNAPAWRLAPCTRLLALSFPLCSFWQQVQAAPDDAVPPQPQAAPAYVAISRMHYRLAMQDLLPWQFYWLQALAGGAPLAQCARQAAQSSGRAPDEVLADAMLWLPMAAGAGIITVDA